MNLCNRAIRPNLKLKTRPQQLLHLNLLDIVLPGISLIALLPQRKLTVTCGLYYKHITIVIDAASVVSK
jgi:hypothetical protein